MSATDGRSQLNPLVEEYAAMADQWYKYAQGFLLVYSITDRASFENMSFLRQDILRAKDRPSVPLIVLSNKVSGQASKPGLPVSLFSLASARICTEGHEG